MTRRRIFIRRLVVFQAEVQLLVGGRAVLSSVPNLRQR
jgi:hypothetical protein